MVNLQETSRPYIYRVSYNGSTFPILEILIRLTAYNPTLGNYICHHPSGTNVVLTTTTATIIIPAEIIDLQESSPESIDETTLRLLAFSM